MTPCHRRGLQRGAGQGAALPCFTERRCYSGVGPGHPGIWTFVCSVNGVPKLVHCPRRDVSCGVPGRARGWSEHSVLPALCLSVSVTVPVTGAGGLVHSFDNEQRAENYLHPRGAQVWECLL